MDVPSMIPPTCLVDWLAELDPAGFLLCYLPILATLGHKNARDVVNKHLALSNGSSVIIPGSRRAS